MPPDHRRGVGPMIGHRREERGQQIPVGRVDLQQVESRVEPRRAAATKSAVVCSICAGVISAGTWLSLR